jgi:hypothetical protein
MKIAYYNHKQNARRRGKEYSLTFIQFKTFAVRVDYLAKRGRKSYSYHIDRIDETQGYHWWNIQILTNVDNVKKYMTWKYDEKGKPIEFYTVTSRSTLVPIVEEDDWGIPEVVDQW